MFLSPFPPPKGSARLPDAKRIQSLPDLELATKWLTNSDSLWQGAQHLLNIFLSPLISFAFDKPAFSPLK
ncbi:hypothetical protein [Rhizobium sp. NFR03]|uniref:hypothetical protein n=1 Tax=Rhizobium sp. NFR03 TaxID=1566263 RepID=UPI001114F9CB|nr:hypothetical protein [Rhizobium sp. NFR03]